MGPSEAAPALAKLRQEGRLPRNDPAPTGVTAVNPPLSEDARVPSIAERQKITETSALNAAALDRKPSDTQRCKERIVLDA
jgi:hypothetical protein